MLVCTSCFVGCFVLVNVLIIAPWLFVAAFRSRSKIKMKYFWFVAHYHSTSLLAAFMGLSIPTVGLFSLQFNCQPYIRFSQFQVALHLIIVSSSPPQRTNPPSSAFFLHECRFCHCCRRWSARFHCICVCYYFISYYC